MKPQRPQRNTLSTLKEYSFRKITEKIISCVSEIHSSLRPGLLVCSIHKLRSTRRCINRDTLLLFNCSVCSVVIFVGMGCFQNSQNKTSNPELQIMQRAGSYVERGQYVEARDIYTQFIEKFPDHPYIDDAAYRLSYLHLIDEEENPFFSYQNAQILFENFIENYPNSRYINACKNWLNLLNHVSTTAVDPDEISKADSINTEAVNRLNKEIVRLHGENKRLQKVLDELQNAIAR